MNTVLMEFIKEAVMPDSVEGFFYIQEGYTRKAVGSFTFENSFIQSERIMKSAMTRSEATHLAGG